jgi:hypothetical protein
MFVMSMRSSGNTPMVAAGRDTDRLQTILDQSEIDLVVDALKTGDRQTADRALAQIEAAAAERPRRRPGRFKDLLVVGDEFFEPLPEDLLQDLDGA